MFSHDYTEFKPFHNSFLCSSLIQTRDHEKEIQHTTCTKRELLNNLSSISALYLYTGAPPFAYGSQGPKVAETVLRAYSFNFNEVKSSQIQGLEVEDLHWKGDLENFPFGEIHGNFIVPIAYRMCKKFLQKYCMAIDQIVDQTIDRFSNCNADILTKGRQTCCPLKNRSVTAASAYKEMYDFLKGNTGETIFSGLEWIRSFCQLLNSDRPINGTREIEVTRMQIRYCPSTKQRKRVQIKTKKMEKHQYSADESFEYMVSISTMFESYLKSSERAHKDRRAIASANMIMRMFLLIIEEFHLELGKATEGSTISIGGEQKKQKISATINSATITSTNNPAQLQGTEDASKWNECLSPALFALMHKTFFDPETRKILGLPPPSRNGTLFQRIAVTGNFLMALKKIKLGPGPVGHSEETYNRIEWGMENISRFNKSTQEWVSKCHNKIKGNFLTASPGMLMGMLNAGSTTIGLLATGFNMDESIQKVVTLRSSDDSMSIYIGKTWALVRDCISKNKTNLEAIAINQSEKKTLFFSAGYGEYTSWYQDGNFVSQYGVETASIKPQGQNPQDDFGSVAKGVSTALQTLTINPLGATIRLKLGVDGCRRLWRIERNPAKREGVTPNILLMADGGIRSWHFANSHLEETTLREHFVKTDQDREYLLRIRNPNNPFNRDPDQEVVFSKEKGQLVMETVDTPRTIFHYCKRSNRTAKTSTRQQLIEEEEANGEAIKIIRNTLPHTYIRPPTTSSLISSNLIAMLSILSSGVELSSQERLDLEEAIAILRDGKPTEEDSELGSWNMEDL